MSDREPSEREVKPVDWIERDAGVEPSRERLGFGLASSGISERAKETPRCQCAAVKCSRFSICIRVPLLSLVLSGERAPLTCTQLALRKHERPSVRVRRRNVTNKATE